jgi:hypothetical protein
MRIGLKALLLCAAMAIVWSNTGLVAAPPPTRSYAAGRFALEIEGNIVGSVTGAEGGLAFGEVVREPSEDFFFKKHLGNAGFRDIRLEFGADMDKSFYNSIALALQGQLVRLNGAILGADFNNNVVSRLEFQDALITEVGFPAADAASKDVVRLSIVLSPDRTALNRKPSGKLNLKSTITQKKWLSSTFRLTIDGVDTKRVTKIDALTIKLPRLRFGDEVACLHCENLSGPAQVDFPDLVVTTGEPADSWYDWFEGFVVQGNNDDSQEKGGTLEYLASDLKTVLFTIKFRNLGIFELMQAAVDAGGSSVPRLLAAMYCESMELLVP